MSSALPSPPSTGGAPVATSGGTAEGEDHSLSFRVMRLARPSFKPSFAGIKCELLHHGDEVKAVPHPSSGADWSSQVQMTHPSKACDLDGSLVLPQNFGSIQLGETFSCYISLGNVSTKPVSNISIRVELQTERQRRNIFENTSKPLETLAPGQRYDFIIQHDVKELGTHTLVCSSVYTEGGAARQEQQPTSPIDGGIVNAAHGDRKYLPQWYKFKVTNPLVVRMKVRTVSNQLKQRTFVEACLENATGDPLLLDVVKFEQTQGYKLLDMNANPTSSSEKTVLEDPGEVGDYLSDLVLLKPRGGSYNFVFGLERCVNDSRAGGPKDAASAPDASGGSGLGKLEIRWSKPMGDSGRLQTQQIQGVASHNKKSLIEARVIRLEKRSSGSGAGGGGIHLHSCFSITVRVTNLTDRTMYGVFVVLGLNGVMRNVGPSGMYFKEIPSGTSPAPEEGGALVGSSKCVEITFDLIALQVGVHKLGTVLLYDERGKQVTETPCSFSVEILPPPQKKDKEPDAQHARHDTLEIPRSTTLDSNLGLDSLLDVPSIL